MRRDAEATEFRWRPWGALAGRPSFGGDHGARWRGGRVSVATMRRAGGAAEFRWRPWGALAGRPSFGGDHGARRRGNRVSLATMRRGAEVTEIRWRPCDAVPRRPSLGGDHEGRRRGNRVSAATMRRGARAAECHRGHAARRWGAASQRDHEITWGGHDGDGVVLEAASRVTASACADRRGVTPRAGERSISSDDEVSVCRAHLGLPDDEEMRDGDVDCAVSRRYLG